MRLVACICSLLLALGAGCSASDGGTDLPGSGKSGGGDGKSGSGKSGDDDQTILDVGEQGAPVGCGDGKLADNEACDDNNVDSFDGCSANCLQLEPGFSCSIPGQPCQPIARCGDGLVAPSEQCDDGNQEDQDGCNSVCRVELGSKCSGEPSKCVPEECGNGTRDGAEACDDGNDQPFDGCSSLCLREPNCAGLSCTSECGDGLVIDEDCDDGNTIDGDGCSSECKREPGFECSQESTCERINGECVLRVPTVFRDFSVSHPDFIPTGQVKAATLLRGSVRDQLDADGRPVLSGTNSPSTSYITSADTFSEWYRDGSHAQTLVSEVTLFDNGMGGYVNRFGANGEKFVSVASNTESNAGKSRAECETACVNIAQTAQKPFEGERQIYCNNDCGEAERAPDQVRNGPLIQAENSLAQAEREGDAAAVAEAEAEIADLMDEIEALEAAAAECYTDCEAELQARIDQCVATCKPCSNDASSWCAGGEAIEWDGTPLFFPVDSIATNEVEPAKIPAQYGYIGWPFEDVVFPGAPDHNFYFTSEVQYWFRYSADINATLDFLGDDDVWVFINGKLAIDIGGIHVPVSGSVTIDGARGTLASTVAELPDAGDATVMPRSFTDDYDAADFGLEAGKVYKITIFHAERQPEGSSFKLTLAGFEATPSECKAICGDGVLSFGEECDDGDNDGGYGECDADCKLGPYCGDGVRQEEFEDCDNGPGGGDGCPNCRVLLIK